ncbi:hypothetical protein K3495_g11442 [Podosphaera aphanis]|nr:hypothetical protein K3495_g11442 [Podosphaera aphanis]
MDIDGRREMIWGYVMPNLAYPIILGKPWMEYNDVIYSAKRKCLRIGSRKYGMIVRASDWYEQGSPTAVQKRISHVSLNQVAIDSGIVFAERLKRARESKDITLGAISINDINRALEPKKSVSKEEVQRGLPEKIRSFTDLFLDDDVHRDSALPPHRPGVDTNIRLQQDDRGRDKEVPWGPLYGMSRDELLVLRKTLTELLDKSWIHASSSPGGAPVLSIRKPNGGLRFCVDYRTLNAITKRDRYPLPLIRGTLGLISNAAWVSKVDVRAAFHCLRVAKGDEWKTAFRTRFGSYEWLVTPFGLAGAPAAFQRWINQVLGDLLGNTCAAYLDDIIIFSDGDLADHWVKVQQVLKRLRDAGLRLDPQKCEFASKEIKYLGFIISVKEGIKVDPDKVKAISTWEVPKNVKGVRSFLGFANFYRGFVKNFAEISNPLLNLTKKGSPFRWVDQHERAFNELKRWFITAPILAIWNESRKTVLETDSSGWATGVCLSQYDDKGCLHPVAYYSKKLAPAECNYGIHDKELLSIIRCLKEWRGELIGLQEPFEILTDHNNLKYFMTTQKLTERQVRWSQFLSQFNFQLIFRPGKLGQRPGALSRRDQDVPNNLEDPRLKEREFQLIKKVWVNDNSKEPIATISLIKNSIPRGVLLFEGKELQDLWDQGVKENASKFEELYSSMWKNERSFPTHLGSKTSLSECEIDARGVLCFRKRIWVPEWEPLQTALIQQTHDSNITGHPGRNNTSAILSRSFYWPKMSTMVRQFCRNCDICGRSHVWRARRQGLLLPLPIPDRFHKELSIDFMTDLPAKDKKDPRYLMVITDRLLKSVTLEAMGSMNAEECAERFLNCHFRFHGFPAALTSDRGSNWVGDFWSHLCKETKMEQRLSTAFHPETDGSTEHMNQEVLANLRSFTSYSQFEWAKMLPAAQLALNNRDSSVSGLSPFFSEHGYHAEPIELKASSNITPRTKPAKLAENFVARIYEAQEYAAAAMASAQQQMEERANRSRHPAPVFRKGDKVWLNLKNIQTPQPKKKLAWVNAKYKVTNFISPHVVELDVPSKVFPRFLVELLGRASDDPLPSQLSDDS